MKEIFSVVLTTLVFVLALPLAYGQQQPLDTTTNIDTASNQNMTAAAAAATPEATIGKNENLTIDDLRFRADQIK